MKTKKTKQEIKKWILENCINEDGDIDLRDLDFSDFDGDVLISSMKVKKDLRQSDHSVGGSLCQDFQKVQEDLHQDFQKVQGNLHQNNQNVKGDLDQASQKVKGKLLQDCNHKKGVKNENKRTN